MLRHPLHQPWILLLLHPQEMQQTLVIRQTQVVRKHTTGSATRTVMFGGRSSPYVAHNSIWFVNTQTTGDAQDFGDLSGSAAFGECGYGKGSKRCTVFRFWFTQLSYICFDFCKYPNNRKSTDYGDSSEKQMQQVSQIKQEDCIVQVHHLQTSTQIDASNIRQVEKQLILVRS